MMNQESYDLPTIIPWFSYFFHHRSKDRNSGSVCDDSLAQQESPHGHHLGDVRPHGANEDHAVDEDDFSASHGRLMSFEDMKSWGNVVKHGDFMGKSWENMGKS